MMRRAFALHVRTPAEATNTRPDKRLQHLGMRCCSRSCFPQLFHLPASGCAAPLLDTDGNLAVEQVMSPASRSSLHRGWTVLMTSVPTSSAIRWRLVCRTNCSDGGEVEPLDEVFLQALDARLN